MFRWFRRNYLFVVLAVVNLAIAAPAGAALDDDICVDNGGLIHCCTSCIFLCACTL